MASDPYTVRHGETREPPASWRARLRYLGPSVVVSGSIVGSGEIILTSSLGAAAGFVLLWWLLLSCWIKSPIQAELGRYVLISGDTYVRAMNRLPGRIPVPRGSISVPIALALIAFVPALMGLGGIVGGAGQALNLLLPALPSTWTTAAVCGAAIALLRPGSYRLLETAMLALVVSFCVATTSCAIAMQFTEYAITRADLAAGLRFEFPAETLVLALAVYGYTGVNAGEVAAYQYWCVEKGYPNFIGRAGLPGWEQRARGWIKVLQADVWITLILLTCATLPFYVLGAGVLRALDKRPSGLDTLAMLSEMFTQTLGPWAVWLFGVGAFFILFSTTLSGIAAGARYLPDYLIELGYLARDDLRARRAWIRGYCTAVPVIAFLFYLALQNPVLLVTIGGLTYALMLPIQSGAVLWLHQTRLDPAIRPGPAMRAVVWAIFAVELLMSGLVVWFVVL